MPPRPRPRPRLRPPSPLHLSPRADDDSTSTNPSALFDVPSSLLTFYEQIGTSGSLDCSVVDGGVGLDTRDGGYETNGSGEDGTRYCGDKEEGPSYVWWESNMDVDCDGAPDGTSGICEGDGSYQSETAFTDDSGASIDAMSVQYVVIDQDDSFDPTNFGIQPLSVVAVICGEGGKMTFGVWADTNALGSMGESSVTLARTCFGSSINGNSGHDEPDVLYIAFPGSASDTAPSGSGSDEDALFQMGQKLVSSVFGGDGDSGSGSSSTASGGGGGSSTKGGEETGGGSTAASTADGSKPSSAATAKTTSSPSTHSSSSSLVSSATSTSSSEDSSTAFDLPSTRTLLVLLITLIFLLSGFVSWWEKGEEEGGDEQFFGGGGE
ncbi:hypothetical protein JCM8547_007668 [Rhodosporidiobolus lusitaniae]